MWQMTRVPRACGIGRLLTLILGASAATLGQSRRSDPTSPAKAESRAPRFAEITDLLIEPTADVVRVIVHLDTGVEYRSERAYDPHRILFDLQGAWATRRFNGRKWTVGVGPLRRVRIAQHGPTTARLVLDTTGEARY